jgi:hypothetical protein
MDLNIEKKTACSTGFDTGFGSATSVHVLNLNPCVTFLIDICSGEHRDLLLGSSHGRAE